MDARPTTSPASELGRHNHDPIKPEDLAARYKDRWVISRDLRWNGTDGDWAADACAPRKPQRITAATIDQLADQLAEREAGRGRRG